jgi:hypothetical protein
MARQDVLRDLGRNLRNQPENIVTKSAGKIVARYNHTRRRRIILLGPYYLGSFGGEHFPAEIASQFL